MLLLLLLLLRQLVGCSVYTYFTSIGIHRICRCVCVFGAYRTVKERHIFLYPFSSPSSSPFSSSSSLSLLSPSFISSFCTSFCLPLSSYPRSSLRFSSLCLSFSVTRSLSLSPILPCHWSSSQDNTVSCAVQESGNYHANEDDRSGGPGLLHYVPVVSTIAKGSNVDVVRNVERSRS